MSIIELIKIAIRSLFSNKVRTFLTMLGIIIGIASVISMLTLGQAVQSGTNSQLNGLGIDLITVSSGKTFSSFSDLVNSTASKSNVKDLTMNDVEIMSDKKNFPDIDSVAPIVNGNFETIKTTTNTQQSQISGIDQNYIIVNGYTMQMGGFITSDNIRNEDAVVVLGDKISNNLFPDGMPLYKTLLINNKTFTVIGVTKSKGNFGPFSNDNVILMPISTIQKYFNVKKSPFIDSISIKATEINKSNIIKADIESYLRIRHGITNPNDDDFSVSSPSQFLDTLNQFNLVFTSFLLCIGSLSLLVGGIGIMNTMLANIAERTKEVGLRKALGANNFDILIQFLVETLVLTGFGGIIGMALGTLITNIGISLSKLPPTFSLGNVIVCTIIIFIISLIFGIYPAVKASRLNPIDALRFE